ncbi:MAG: tetratricopeptide repeat protein [Flavobacteriales bacterium]|nr:tetratricopeptide repeat protein [Flavobacteriales bacterium]
MMLISTLLVTSSVIAQQPNDLIKKGNGLYKDGKFGEAEMTYREGQGQGADAFISGFNLGDALFKQERFEEAASAFQSLPNLTDDKKQKAAAYHNLGNSFMKTKKYQEGVDAYKQALRNNPTDIDTKYNLSYAKRMLQQQDQNKDQDKKDDQQKQDQQKQDEKKDQEKKDQEQKQDQQQQDQQKQDEQKQQQPKEGEISKEDAERTLDALDQDEKKIRDRLEEQKIKKEVKGNIEKDW